MRNRIIIQPSLAMAAFLVLTAVNLTAQIPHYGLAARYPGDVGIQNDSSVVFYDNFENGEIPSSGGKWTHVNNYNDQTLSFVADSTAGSPGRRSILMTVTKGQPGSVGKLWKLLDRGYDQLYFRFYCKFAPDAPYVHHFVHMGGYVNSPPYPMGGAGNSPTGYDRFSTAIDLMRTTNANPPGTWHFYSYWSEMRSWQNDNGTGTSFYGNAFGPVQPLQAKRGEWQCVEIMIKLNSAPDKRDGEQAFWIDGQPISHWAPGSQMGRWFKDRFRVYGSTQYQGSATRDSIPYPFEGFLWSKTDNLKINIIELQYYLESIFAGNVVPADTTIPYNSNVARVQFDDVVAATKYIGPISANAWSRFDFDGDGKRGVGDVYRMLKMRVADPDDMRTDYDGDGRPSIMDALRMLLHIVRE